jgi:KaiC/GvpD/RAD55 family RecA-like ATPase
MSDRLQSALACHALNLSVFPLWPKSKNPSIQRWEPYQFERATPEQLKSWWSAHPDWNIAVACGPLSGVMVVDVDGDRGAETLANLQRQHGPLPRTWRSRTGKGEHIWFRYPDGLDVTNARGQLKGTGIDIRGDGGYVVAPGSIHQSGATYEWQDDCHPDLTPLAEPPEWFLELLKRQPPERKPYRVGELNGSHDRYVDAAFRAEISAVASASEGDRNNTLHRSTIKLATLVAAGELEEGHAKRALADAALSAGLPEPEIAATIESGFKFGLQHPREIPEREPRIRHEPLRAAPASTEAPPPAEIPLYPLVVPENIRPRPWLFGHWLMRGAVTLIAAPGGTGKTALVTSTILSCATGRDLLGIKPLRQMTVAFLGLEESCEEMHRRFKAAMLQHGIDPADFEGRVYYLDGRTYGFSAANMTREGNVEVGADMAKLTALLQTIGADILAADPLALAHSAPENDNNAMARVISYFSALAATCDCAVLLIHHTRKGAQAGDPDGIRGAGALINHARIAIGLSPPSDADKDSLEMSDEDAKRLVRIDDLKMNYAVKSASAKWIELTSVSLNNRTTDYPYGDSVQVPLPWSPPVKGGTLTKTIANAALDILAKGLPGPVGIDRYSAAPHAGERAAWRAVTRAMNESGSSITDHEARNIIRGWLKAQPPVIREEPYFSPNDRKQRIGIFVNEGARS